MPQSPQIIPMLAYEDGYAAIDWLCHAFGFAMLGEPLEYEGRLGHAELGLNGGAVALGSPAGYINPRHHVEVCEPARKALDNPWVVDGVLVYVDDVDTHFEQAKASGATILRVPETQEYGRLYAAADLEGHRWMFIQAPSA